MTLITESGNGDATAESYISVADADARHAAFVVYGLYDPLGELRYVGQTNGPLWKRHADHVAHARADDPRPVLRWIWGIYSAGGAVTIAPLKLNATRNTDESEIIKRMIGLGHSLLNVEHTPARAHLSRQQFANPTVKERHRAACQASMTSERKAKISASLKGRPKSAQHRANISAATKGRDNRRVKP